MMRAVTQRDAFDPKAFLALSGPGRAIVHYEANAQVYAQGSAAETVFYLQHGHAKLTYATKSGKEVVLAILAPGDFFGDRCLTGNLKRTASVTALTGCTMMRLDKAVMMTTLHDEPKFSELFIRHLLERHIRVGADMVEQLTSTSEKRLARMLLRLTEPGPNSDKPPVIANISQETLADMIGTTRSRVSFFMNKFRRLGFIDYKRDMRRGLHVNTARLSLLIGDGTTNGG